MIRLHRMDGSEVVVNADLIELIDTNPHTAITLVDGRTVVVRETSGTVVDLVGRFRAQVLAGADEIRSDGNGLTLIQGGMR